MNGADRLCDTLLANDVDVCFANPGTSEMHFVAALDRKPRIRCVLGLFEGVVTGAADGYARMADKPAATLLHTGPGLANGLANIHNARRARTPMINIVGDHAGYHLQYDAPLTSDIESLARPMSHWVRRIESSGTIERDVGEAYQAAMRLPGIATLILPADSAWGGAPASEVQRTALPGFPQVPAEAVRAAAEAVRSGKPTALMMTGAALRADALAHAGRIAAATGAELWCQQSNGRVERGAGRVPVKRVPYPVDLALKALAHIEVMILVGAKAPVAFFAYPGKPSVLTAEGCQILRLAEPEQDLKGALAWLADELGISSDVTPLAAEQIAQGAVPDGPLNADVINVAVARMMPENAILVDESVTSGRRFFDISQGSAPHDFIQLTGGAIGEGIPLAIGAAFACPDRKVVALQADGSGMYTIQGLWTQARENLDVVTVVFANSSYAILQGEMRGVGVNEIGRNAQRMLDLDAPKLDWVSMAKGMGVEAARATTVAEFVRLFEGALGGRGPFLIEAVI
ncbi:MAG TPA: acetolactate synthase large subunit [Enterovirga sp.]|jgi:acetolactate synthase-1/2/3 large subunit|nr:acetolactate synthase large subunit [Enterovirga sp.]